MKKLVFVKDELIHHSKSIRTEYRSVVSLRKDLCPQCKYRFNHITGQCYIKRIIMRQKDYTRFKCNIKYDGRWETSW